jgi:hypothetical protein
MMAVSLTVSHMSNMGAEHVKRDAQAQKSAEK